MDRLEAMTILLASGEYRAPQGELIITAPAVLGRSHVLPIVAEFQRVFPDIRMRLQLGDRYVSGCSTGVTAKWS